jgi:hypothetical protein
MSRCRRTKSVYVSQAIRTSKSLTLRVRGSDDPSFSFREWQLWREVLRCSAHGVVCSEQCDLVSFCEAHYSRRMVLVCLQRLEMYHQPHRIPVELQRFALRLRLEQSSCEFRPELPVVPVEGGAGFGDVLACDDGNVKVEPGWTAIMPW